MALRRRCSLNVSLERLTDQGYGFGYSGDSWRARATHITELQVNMASGAMRIDFGGLDRWDYPERRRNMEEASRPIQ